MMDYDSIESTKNKAVLIQEITRKLGLYVRFSNGCEIDLKATYGMFEGQSPYGVTWCCNQDESAPEKISNWVTFWDRERDEQGRKLNKMLAK
jgi:hypothetical protein